MSISYTHESRIDGFGAQYQTIITTMIYCSKKNLNYLYSELKHVEHNYKNDPHYINSLENIMNIKSNVMNSGNHNPVELKFKIANKEFEEHIDDYCDSESMHFIKECFWKNKDRDHFKNKKMNISVQIRRENAHDRGNAGLRATTPNGYYLKIMNEIREKYKGNDLLFHIYSQGNITNFKELEKDDVVFHLNEDITSTFVGLVAADILVTSPSSFSYVAALLSDGTIYYKPFWHNPKKTWIVCS